jgi:predicted SnoaL-like aldol condensation-catalyzing enzyme
MHGATARERVNPLVGCAGNDPHDSSKKYKYNSFDTFRVVSGKAEEHWDSADEEWRSRRNEFEIQT